MSVFTKNFAKLRISTEIKDYVIEEMKKGTSPTEIKANAKNKFGNYISLQAVFRIKDEYIKLTGDRIPSFHEFHKLGKHRID
jgi:hypothetical protein